MKAEETNGKNSMSLLKQIAFTQGIMVTFLGAIGGYFLSLIISTWRSASGSQSGHLLTLWLGLGAITLIFIWVGHSSLFSKLFKIDFKKTLKIDAYSYLPLLFFFVHFLPIRFPGHISELEKFKFPIGFVFVSLVYWKAILVLHTFVKHKSLFQYNVVFTKKFLFWFVLVCYLSLSVWVATAIRSGGDEPYYLLVTQSLVKDHDFDISNNFKREDYETFYPQGELTRIVSSRTDGKTYLGMRFGLPVLMLPGFFLGGWYGSVLLMNIIAAFLVVNMFLLMEETLSDKKTAFYLALVLGFSIPLIFYSSRIYHNIPAALLFLLAFRWIKQSDQNLPGGAIASLMIAFLPWLQNQYTIISLILSFYLFIKLINAGKARYFILYMVPLVTSAIIFLVTNSCISGGYLQPDEAGYGFFSNFSIRSSLSTLISIFIDQETGILFYTPIYILAFWGIFYFVRYIPSRLEILVWLAIIISHLSIQSLVPTYGGGYAFNRPLIVIVPFLGVFIGSCLKNKSNRNKILPLFKILSGIGLFISFFLTAFPWLLNDNQNGKNVFFELFLFLLRREGMTI
ncbi:hypothetical protein KAW55_02340 [bacterium]|nr:hypothetical protein [bacterium]